MVIKAAPGGQKHIFAHVQKSILHNATHIHTRRDEKLKRGRRNWTDAVHEHGGRQVCGQHVQITQVERFVFVHLWWRRQVHEHYRCVRRMFMHHCIHVLQIRVVRFERRRRLLLAGRVFGHFVFSDRIAQCVVDDVRFLVAVVVALVGWRVNVGDVVDDCHVDCCVNSGLRYEATKVVS